MNNSSKAKKCSDSQKGRKVIHLGDTEKRVYVDELDSYLSKGWKLGASDKHKQNNSLVKKGSIPHNKGKACPEVTKAKISATLKGNIPWNKGLTAEVDQRVLENTQKANMTKLKKYGSMFPNNNMSEEHKQKISKALTGKKYGKMDPEKLQIKLSKEYITKKINGSFNKSSTEDILYEELLGMYPSKTIYRNYKDQVRYPFYCDFYIVEDDLFIELNAHWTHGGMPFDSTNQKCIDQLAEWEAKAETSQFYKNAIETWTIRDVKKLAYAKKYELNYKVIY